MTLTATKCDLPLYLSSNGHAKAITIAPKLNDQYLTMNVSLTSRHLFIYLQVHGRGVQS